MEGIGGALAEKKFLRTGKAHLNGGMYLFEIVLFRISARIWGNKMPRGGKMSRKLWRFLERSIYFKSNME